jgi:DNA-binding MarR family transcriptional regulator
MSAETFSESMELFFRTMRRARTKSGDIEVTGLSMPQFVLLVPLIDGRARSVRELAAAAAVASPTATRMLDALQRDGVVQRRPSETDRRCVLVDLTEHGRAVLETARERARARRVELYELLEPSEREDAERIMRRLAEVTEAAGLLTKT